MKRFLLTVSLFGLIFAAIYGALILYVFKFEHHNREHYLYAQKNKVERLDSIDSPRIILLGGSSVAMGFDSHELTDSLGGNVYNMGVHASIGIRFILDAIGDKLRPGDTLVIMPEYSQFSTSYNGSNETLTDAIVYSGSDNLKKLNFEQLANFVSGIPQHILGNRGARYSETKFSYSARNFNKFGDEVRHLGFPATKLSNPPQKVKLPENSYVEDFAKKVLILRRKGVNVMMVWPTTIQSQYELNADYINLLDKQAVHAGIPFITSPDYLVHPDSLAFDTPYHMTAPAIQLNTSRLQALLHKKIK